MKEVLELKKIGFVIGAGLLTTLALLPQAKGDLVVATPPTPTVMPGTVLTVPTQAVVAQPVAQAQPTVLVAQAAPAIAQAAPLYAQAAPAQIGVENLSRTELLRRERMREELKNEDVLQSRLEELRLQEERKRTQSLLEGGSGSTGVAATQVAPLAPKVPETQSEVVIKPVTDRPGEEADMQASSVSAVSMNTNHDKLRISIQPRGGFSSLMGSNQFFKTQGRFSAGVGIILGVTKRLNVEAGYSYNEYGISVNSINPFIQTYQAYGGNNYYDPQNETMNFKQNVFDAGIKVHLLEPQVRIRPFLGGGAAYSMGNVNYDQRILEGLRRSGIVGLESDYQVSSFSGYVTTGFDFRVSKSISVGASFKLYKVLTSRESQTQQNNAYGYTSGYGNYGYGYGGYTNSYNYTLPDSDKRGVGSAIAQSGFYSILVGISLTF